jgi:hypothetical protein
MAPIRRYLRISKYSVLECRIYLDNPADTRWLLDPRDPVLRRIFTLIKPLVLPKLREENERAKARKKSNPVKDVIAEDEFEVAIFLRESGTRHSILRRYKTFGVSEGREGNQYGLGSTDASPIDVTESTLEANPAILVESDNESDVDLQDIPESTQAGETSSQSERQRGSQSFANTLHLPRSTRNRTGAGEGLPGEEDGTDDKKLGMATTYEGFNIWGWVLCLLVTRRGQKARTVKPASGASGQVLLEEWMSTQVQQDIDED